MPKRTPEFVGGPMDGDRCKAKYTSVGEVVFLTKITPPKDPHVHVYACSAYGEDFVYQGLRPYTRGDAGRILGTVP